MNTALRERTILLRNAPHLSSAMPFLMPVYGARGRWLQKWFYGAGLLAYALLAGKAGLGSTEFLSASDLIAPSQGVHLVVDREFLPGKHGLLVPKTRDGRVLFAVPWLGKIILGTTDTPCHELASEPRAFPEEIQFILDEAANYLSRAPTRADVRSIWVGLRPLVKASNEEAKDTRGLSREHTVLIGQSQLVTVTGGKWTTYRAMAEDLLAQCEKAGLLPALKKSTTDTLQLVGAPAMNSNLLSEAPGLHSYGCDVPVLQSIQGFDRELAPGLSEAMVRFTARCEFARSVEDVLARRSRLLFLDAAGAIRIADEVAEILAGELGEAFNASDSAADFRELAAGYLLDA